MRELRKTRIANLEKAAKERPTLTGLEEQVRSMLLPEGQEALTELINALRRPLTAEDIVSVIASASPHVRRDLRDLLRI